MNIEILSPHENTDNIDGMVIVIDVFRAFSTNCYMAANNPDKIIPVYTIDETRKLSEIFANCILVGERKREKIEGFHFGNSPTEVVDQDFSGKYIVHTTTLGTKGLVRQKESNDTITGSFVNCGAIVKYINRKKPENLYLYCTAWKEISLGNEDLLFAEYLYSILKDKEIDFWNIREKLRAGSSHVFREDGPVPESDFNYCLDLDRFDFILRRKMVENEEYRMELMREKV